MTKRERLLLKDDLAYIEEIHAILNEVSNFFREEIVKTRSDDKLLKMSKFYEKLGSSAGKLEIITKRWELYDYDSKD